MNKNSPGGNNGAAIVFNKIIQNGSPQTISF
jgi:hypothetical protein